MLQVIVFAEYHCDFFTTYQVVQGYQDVIDGVHNDTHEVHKEHSLAINPVISLWARALFRQVIVHRSFVYLGLFSGKIEYYKANFHDFLSCASASMCFFVSSAG